VWPWYWDVAWAAIASMSRTVDDARHGDFAEPIGGPGTIDLYWIPLGAGARVVRLSGSCYELLMAAVQRRPRRDLFHSALIVTVPEGRYSIEMTPIPDRLGHQRGVVAEGCVGSGWLGRWRLFRYEIRCWPDGLIPDLDAAIGEPERLSSDDRVAHSLLEVLPSIPTPVWGRDAMGAGEMWNSNSVTSWALTRSGIDLADVAPPNGGRAPGWDAGRAAARSTISPRSSSQRRNAQHGIAT
jgi:hypothetical protein